MLIHILVLAAHQQHTNSTPTNYRLMRTSTCQIQQMTCASKDKFHILWNGAIYCGPSCCSTCLTGDIETSSNILQHGNQLSICCISNECTNYEYLHQVKDISNLIPRNETEHTEILCLDLFQPIDACEICAVYKPKKTKKGGDKKRGRRGRCQQGWLTNYRTSQYKYRNEQYQNYMCKFLTADVPIGGMRSVQQIMRPRQRLPMGRLHHDADNVARKYSPNRVKDAVKKIAYIISPKKSRRRIFSPLKLSRLLSARKKCSQPHFAASCPQDQSLSTANIPLNKDGRMVFDDDHDIDDLISKADDSIAELSVDDSFEEEDAEDVAEFEGAEQECSIEHDHDIDDLISKADDSIAELSVDDSFEEEDAEDMAEFEGAEQECSIEHMINDAMNIESVIGSRGSEEEAFWHNANQQLFNLPAGSSASLQYPSSSIDTIRKDQLRQTIEDLLISNGTMMDAVLRDHGYAHVSKFKTVVGKSQFGYMQKIMGLLKNSKKRMKNKKYASNATLQRRFTAFSSLLTPKASQDRMEIISQLSRAAAFEEIGFHDLIGGDFGGNEWEDMFARTGVKENSTVGNITGEAATDLLFLLRQEIIDIAAVYISSDKGQGGHLAKVLTWYSEQEGRVKKFTIDIDKCSGFSSETAEGLKFSIDRIYLNKRYNIKGGGSDAGGGGTGESLKKELVRLRVMAHDAIMSLCGLHGIQLVFKNPIELILGKGGLESRTALQLLHDYFNIQEALGHDVWAIRFKNCATHLGIPMRNEYGTATTSVPILQEPILSQWWTVGEGSKIASYNEEILIELMLQTIESKRTNTDIATTKIATNTLSLALEKSVQSDMKLIRGFSRFFLEPHMDWLQLGDKRCGDTAGFSARNMLVQYFFMNEDLEKLRDGIWITDNEFKDFVETLNVRNNVSVAQDIPAIEIDETTGELIGNNIKLRDLRPRPIKDIQLQKNKASKLFEAAWRALHNCDHFQPYRKNLLFLGLFGEGSTPAIVRDKILGAPINLNHHGTELCESHDRLIDLKAFGEFLEWGHLDEYGKKVDTVWEERRECERFKRFTNDELEILGSPDFSIWDARAPPAYATLAPFYKITYSALPTTTHFVERAVKTAALSKGTSRSDTRATHFAIGSNLIEEVNNLAVQHMIQDRRTKGKPCCADVTETMKGYFLFKGLRKGKHFNMLKEELQLRNLEFSDKATYSDLKKQLRSAVGEESRGFMPKFGALAQWHDAHSS